MIDNYENFNCNFPLVQPTGIKEFFIFPIIEGGRVHSAMMRNNIG